MTVMDNPRRYVLVMFFTLLAGLGLGGCVSTLPEEGGIKERDPALFEQKNLEIAYGFLREGYPGRAIGRLNEILKVNSDSARAYGMLGVVYQSQGEYELAADSFKNSLSIDSSASDVRNNYGVLLFEMKKYDVAREQFEKVTEDIYYNQRSRAFENLGFVALRTDDSSGGKALFERALRLDRNLVKASLELTDIFYQDGNFVEAERFFQNYIRLTQRSRPEPRGLWLGIELARIFKRTEQLEQYAEQLGRYYPGSQEYRKYQASLRND